MAFQTIEDAAHFAYRVARRLGRTEHDAADASQDVAELLLSHPPRSMDMAWISRVTTRLCANAYRRTCRELPFGLPSEDDEDATPQERFLAEYPDPATLPAPSESGPLLFDPQPFLRRLSVKERRTLTLCAEVGQNEAARRLQLSVGTVGNQLKSARRKVRTAVLRAGIRLDQRASTHREDL